MGKNMKDFEEALQKTKKSLKQLGLPVQEDDWVISTSGDLKGIAIGHTSYKEVEEEYNNIDMNDKYNKWTQDGDNFIPTGNIVTVKTVPCGLYKLSYNDSWGYYMAKENYYNDEVLNLPLVQLTEILKDISSFWGSIKQFEKYGYTHKRGILMYGKPGCGKSFAIQLIIKNLIEIQKGIVIKIEDPQDLANFKSFFNQRLRIIEPHRKVVVIIEDIDGLAGASQSTETSLLNLLDGINQSNNIIYLATTNYPEKLKERITNRPSRFDRRYDFSYPDADVREFYFKNKLDKKDIKKYGGMKKWVDSSENLTLAHMRELIISTVILGNDFDIVLKELFDMNKVIVSESNHGAKIGFGNRK
jgi:hypothetical protein